MDNAILIVAGDAIDTSLGVLLGISTMCAAAIGNIVSDVAGIGLGTVIEDACGKYLNLRQPVLSHAQRQLRSVRWSHQLGCAAGIVIGCVIGMFPLLFIDSQKIQVRKQEAAMDAIFKDVMQEASSLIGAARTELYLMVDKDHPGKPTPDGNFLYAKYADRSWRVLGRGIISRAALTGEAWNIYDVTAEPDYEKVDETVKNMACVPVLDAQGRAIAVLQATNKEHGFSDTDVQILKALASHISVALQRLGTDEEVGLKDTIQMLKDYGLSGIEGQAQSKRRLLFPEE